MLESKSRGEVSSNEKKPGENAASTEINDKQLLIAAEPRFHLSFYQVTTICPTHVLQIEPFFKVRSDFGLKLLVD